MNCGLATFCMMTLRAKIDETYAALQYEQSLYFPQTEKIVSLEMDLKCLQTLHATIETRELIAYCAIGLCIVACLMFAVLSALFECTEWYTVAWMMTKCEELSTVAVRFSVLIFSLYCVVFCPPVFIVHLYVAFNAMTVCYIVSNISKCGAIRRNCHSIVGFVTQNYQNIMLSVIAVMMCVIALK